MNSTQEAKSWKGEEMKGLPKAIGRFHILSELGQGGMGVVYLAMDPILKRRVAIKCMKAPEGRQNALKRFQREAETSSRLNHPNIITVYDVGEDPDVGPYLAMEFIEGASLESLLAERTLTREEGFRILTQVMYGLMAAHEAGIIHRDVKPENLLVAKDGRVKLMDFGIAKAGGERLTAVGEVLGSPSFTAPELLLGQEATPQSDMYAFVVTAFEVITGGDLPFKGDSLGATLYKVIHDPPVMPPDLDPKIAHVFQRGLNKEPTQRFNSLHHFMSTLAKALGFPVPSQVPQKAVFTPEHPPQPRQSPPSQADIRTAAVPASQNASNGSHDVPAKDQGSADFTRGVPREKPHPAPAAKPSPPGNRPSPSLPMAHKQAFRNSHTHRLGKWIVGAAMAGCLVGLCSWGYVAYDGRRTHPVTISTIPPGARIWVDNKEVGTSPCTLNLSVRATSIQVQRAGYVPAEFPLTRKDREISTPLVLQKGYFRVITQPPGANAFLDGRPIGPTPIWSWRTPDRSVELRIEHPGSEAIKVLISPDHLPLEPLVLKPRPFEPRKPGRKP